MLDTPAETSQDRRPAILVCVYEADDPAWAALDDPSAEPWSPASARTRSVGPGDPAILAGLISDELSGTDVPSVLLVGRTRRSDGFRVQMRAENRGLTGGGKLSNTGPALARATAPVAEIVRALNEAGLSADATSDSEEDAGSYLLYRVLTALPDNADAPAVGLLRAPFSVDAAQLRRGVRAAAGVMARHMEILPRLRPG
jgi:hypothetical protein